MVDSKIIQIMPAVGWVAEYGRRVPSPGPNSPDAMAIVDVTLEPVVAWALCEDEDGYRVVKAMVSDGHGYLEFAGLTPPGDVVLLRVEMR